MLNGRKVFGSAQRRGGDRFLLHGSLVLARNPAATGAVSLEELLGRVVTLEEAEAAIVNAAAVHWSVELERAEPTAAELVDADRLVRERYANPEWTQRR